MDRYEGHTPGPYKARFAVVETQEKNPRTVARCVGASDAEAAANARLLAAAPALLAEVARLREREALLSEHLAGIVALIDGGGFMVPGCVMHEAARAALAGKAGA